MQLNQLIELWINKNNKGGFLFTFISYTEGIFKAADMEKILFDIKAENDDISSNSESYSNSIVSVTNL